MIKIVFKIEIEVLKSSTLVYAIYIYFTYTLMQYVVFRYL